MNGLSAWDIRKFLLKQPRATRIRLSSGDEVQQEIDCKKVRSWSKIAETIHAVGAELIEVLSKDGTLIRALRTESDDLERSRTAPEPPPVVHDDPETARLTHFANLIHRAYEHATEVAFQRLVDLTERMDSRSESIEARLERTEANYRRALQDQVDDALDLAEERVERAHTEAATDPQSVMASAFLGGIGRAKTPAGTPPNGKGGPS